MVSPLWVYDDGLDNLVKVIADILSFDNDSKRDVEASFNWESKRCESTEKLQFRHMTVINLLGRKF